MYTAWLGNTTYGIGTGVFAGSPLSDFDATVEGGKSSPTSVQPDWAYTPEELVADTKGVAVWHDASTGKSFTAGAVVMPTTPDGFEYVNIGSAGYPSTGQPNFPGTLGATVGDGHRILWMAIDNTMMLWTANKAYAYLAEIISSPDNGYYYANLGAAGTSGNSQPNLPEVIGNTIGDGPNIIWECMSLSAPAWQAGHYYHTFDEGLVRPTVPIGFRYNRGGISGTSGDVEPGWPTVHLQHIGDGTPHPIIWQCSAKYQRWQFMGPHNFGAAAKVKMAKLALMGAAA